MKLIHSKEELQENVFTIDQLKPGDVFYDRWNEFESSIESGNIHMVVSTPLSAVTPPERYILTVNMNTGVVDCYVKNKLVVILSAELHIRRKVS